MTSKRRPASLPKRTKTQGAGAPDEDRTATGARRRSDTIDRERRFVEHYFANGLDGTQAAIAAGYSDNYATACSMASRVLRRPSVVKMIEAIRAKEGDASQERRRRIIESLEATAFADVSRLFDNHGNLQPITQLDAHTKKLIAGIEVNEMQIGENAMSITRKVKIKDQLRAKELLGRFDGTLVDKHEHSGHLEVVEVTTFTKPPRGKKQ